MLKYISKMAMDILPSVAATIIGAYIVNHYIVAKPAADAPRAAAVSPADPKKPDPASADVANIPGAGVRAKGVSEKAVFEKAAVEKSAAEKPRDKSAEKPPEKPQEKAQERPEDKPAETASIPVEAKRQPAAPREKTAIRTIPLAPAAQPAVPVVAPAAVPANPAPTVEATSTPDDRRDANDLARAAIERLRVSNGGSPRTPEAPRVVSAPPQAAASQAPVPQAVTPMVRPLPPPIMVSTPPSDESFGSAAGPSPMQPNSVATRIDDPRRPIPPADIPPSRPLDLNAQPVDSSVREHHNVAEDMLLAAKSVFHAVLPQ
jgi:hypothetical protein